jgi:tryptophan 2,3-dioxygenase
MTKPLPATYWDYIRVEDLLALQSGIERDESKLTNDEVMFITVHQVFELWFKLILREVRTARDLFTAERVAEQELSGAVRSLKRGTSVLRIANMHWEVMETMTPRDFLAFRDKLFPASGFQSAQLRQIEILLGLPEDERIPMGPAGIDKGYLASLKAHDGRPSPAYERVKRELEDVPTLKDAIDAWLARTPIDGSEWQAPDDAQNVQRFVDAFLKAHGTETDRACEHTCALAQNPADIEALRRRYDAEKRSVQAFFAAGDTPESVRRRRIRAAMLFIETYRELPLLAWPRELLDSLVELEQFFVIFRQRHARMVERIIGRRTGTGGSAGVDYLDATALKYRIFRDLWAIRTLQIPREAAPKLESAEWYGFRNA